MLTVSREALQSKLEIAAKVCPTRTPKDILRYAKLECDGETLTITATDHEVGVKLTMPAKGNLKPLLVPAAQVVKALRLMIGDEVEIDADSTGVWIAGTRENIRRPLVDPAEFPDWKHTETCRTVIEGLSAVIDRVSVASDVESTRYALGGVNLLLDATPEAQATDSRVLAIEPLKVMEPCKWSGVVPLKGIVLAADILIGSVHASFGKNTVEFTAAGSVVWSTLVEGRFPRARDVVPKTFEVEFDVPVSDLIRVLKLARLGTTAESRGVALHVSEGVLTVEGSSSEEGDSKVELPVVCEGECWSVLDPDYVLKLLGILDPLDVVHWGMNAKSAHLFAVRDWKAVIMPIARDEE